MLCENFTSAVLAYRTRTELPPELFGYIHYHPEIPEPWAEEFGGVQLRGLFFDPNNEGLLVANASMDYVYWPGWNNKTWTFDANTGAFIRHGEFIGSSFYGYSFFQGAGGELYQSRITGDAYALNADYSLGERIDPDTYDVISLNVFMVDRQRNLIVMASTSENKQAGIYNFTTGALVERIDLPDAVKDICHAQGTRVYILLDNHCVVGLDYVTREFFEYVKIPQLGADAVVGANIRIAYDKRFRRLLACWVTPNAENGASTTVIHGYLNRPVPTHVCKPIPLKRLRASETTPVLCKAVGDLGEGLVGMATLEATTVPGRVVRTQVPLDGAGEGTTTIIGTSEGDEVLDVSAEAACLL